MQDSRAAQSQTNDINLVAGLTATQPGEPGRATLHQERGIPVSELGFELFDGEMFRRRQRYRFDGPAHVTSGNGLALCAFPRAAHSVGEAFGEHEAVLRRAIIVFAGADVATSAVEMDVPCRRDIQLSEKTRDTGKIRIRNARSIVTLRMRREITQNRHGPLVIPEADE